MRSLLRLMLSQQHGSQLASPVSWMLMEPQSCTPVMRSLATPNGNGRSKVRSLALHEQSPRAHSLARFCQVARLLCPAYRATGQLHGSVRPVFQADPCACSWMLKRGSCTGNEGDAPWAANSSVFSMLQEAGPRTSKAAAPADPPKASSLPLLPSVHQHRCLCPDDCA